MFVERERLFLPFLFYDFAHTKVITQIKMESRVAKARIGEESKEIVILYRGLLGPGTNTGTGGGTIGGVIVAVGGRIAVEEEIEKSVLWLQQQTTSSSVMEMFFTYETKQPEFFKMVLFVGSK